MTRLKRWWQPAQESLTAHPARLVAIGFAGTIALGTLLLLLPVSRSGPSAPDVVTALFTATSAVSVTGLTVVDTETYWSATGEAVILLLMQLGGLGIMTMASLLGLLVSRRLGLRSRMLVAAETRAVDIGTVRRLLVGVLQISLVLELVAWVVITARLSLAYDIPFGRALYLGLFHAVSGFNSAGLALWPDNLMQFAGDVWILTPLSAAFMLGAFGYPVLLELRRERRPRHWSVHTRLTLVTIGVMSVLAPLMIVVNEWSGTLASLRPGDKVLAAVFSGLSASSAGFNVIDFSQVEAATLLGTDLLMFIGGGSGGTAGGVKVTTIAVLLLAVMAEIRGDDDVEAFGRRIGPSTVRQALTVVMLSLAVIALGAFALLRTAPGTDLDHALFEVVSAFSNNGLSSGITADLPDPAKLLLSALMYVGRVGPITAATALALRHNRKLYRYPETRPIVG